MIRLISTKPLHVSPGSSGKSSPQAKPGANSAKIDTPFSVPKKTTPTFLPTPATTRLEATGARPSSPSDQVLPLHSSSLASAPQTPDCDPAIIATSKIQAQHEALSKRYAQADQGTPLQIVVIPSKSVGSPIDGHALHVEQRYLWEALAQRESNSEIIFVLSKPIADDVLNYTLAHCDNPEELRSRLSFVVLNDPRSLPIEKKLLSSKKGLADLQARVQPERALIHAFASGQKIHDLGEVLGTPVEGPRSPELDYWGTKSGGRKLFTDAGLTCFDGANDLHSRRDLVQALLETIERNPTAQRAVVKMNESVSGRGNAVFNIPQFDPNTSLTEKHRLIEAEIDRLDFPGCSLENFDNDLAEVGCVIELFAEGEFVEELTGMFFIHTDGRVEALATHGQFTNEKMAYQGGSFPAPSPFRASVQDATFKVGQELAKRGVVGYFGVDYLAVSKTKDSAAADFNLFPLEINLRQVGSTHGLQIAKAVTDAEYCPNTHVLKTKDGTQIHYWVSDHVMDDDANLKGIKWTALEKILRDANLLYNPKTHTGLVFHNISALDDTGKIGVTAIATTAEDAERTFRQAGTFLKSL